MLETILIRDFGLGHKLVAVWEGNEHIGQIEFRTVGDKVTEIYALGVRAVHRRKGYGRRIVEEIVKNPECKLNDVQPAARAFWSKVLPQAKVKGSRR